MILTHEEMKLMSQEDILEVLLLTKKQEHAGHSRDYYTWEQIQDKIETIISRYVAP